MEPLATQVLTLANMPPDAVLRRLGWVPVDRRPDESVGTHESSIQRFIASTAVRTFHREASLVSTGGGFEIGGHAVRGELVEKRLRGASGVVLLAASATAESMQLLMDIQDKQDLQQAIVLDAVLSEKVDFALDFIEQQLAADWRRSRRAAGRRFSCGYGDFTLEHQPFFFEALHLGRYGIRISERHILYPEKTVTAVLPVFAGA